MLIHRDPTTVQQTTQVCNMIGTEVQLEHWPPAHITRLLTCRCTVQLTFAPQFLKLLCFHLMPFTFAILRYWICMLFLCFCKYLIIFGTIMPD